MAPRARPRKVGLGRMDAAIDAMALLGFSKDVVKRMVNQLLKVYEGDGGWVFIEEASYRLLIDTILEDQEESEHEKIPAEEKERGEDEGQPSFSGPLSKVLNNIRPCDAGPIVGVRDVAESSATGTAHGILELTCSKPQLVSTDSETNGKDGISCLPSAEGEGRQWRDIAFDKHSGPKQMDDSIECTGGNSGVVNAIHFPEQVLPCHQPVDNLPKKRRIRCNGWISNDDEYNLVHSSSTISPRQFNKMIGGAEGRRNRKSRWDVRPEEYAQLTS